jgi:hypothetical protein
MSPPRLIAIPALAFFLAAPGTCFAQSDPPAGKYECWHFSTPLPGMNLTIKGGGQYIDAEGKTGSYTIANGQIAFTGGDFDGQRTKFRPGKPPTIAIIGPSGGETETCQPPG